jgi:O-antigen ligase
LITGPELIRERFATGTDSGAELAGRVDFWRVAGVIWSEHPVLGIGLGGFPAAYAEARVPAKEFLPSTLFEPPPHAHSLMLQLLAEQGLLGLVAFGAVFVAALLRTVGLRRSPDGWIRAMGTAALAALVAFFVHNLFDVTLLERTGTYFWGLLGLVSALSILAGAAGEPEPAPTVVAAGA